MAADIFIFWLMVKYVICKGKFGCLYGKQLNSDKFKSGGLYEKHAAGTSALGTISASR
jgi:hypothetical protein